MRSEIRAAVHKSEEHLTFDACIEAGVEVKTALRLDAEYNRRSRLHLKDRWQRKPEITRARVKLILILVKAIAHRARRSNCTVVIVVNTAAVATATMATAASSISKAMEAACRVLEHPSNLAHTSSAKSLVIVPRTAK